MAFPAAPRMARWLPADDLLDCILQTGHVIKIYEQQRDSGMFRFPASQSTKRWTTDSVEAPWNRVVVTIF